MKCFFVWWFAFVYPYSHTRASLKKKRDGEPDELPPLSCLHLPGIPFHPLHLVLKKLGLASICRLAELTGIDNEDAAVFFLDRRGVLAENLKVVYKVHSASVLSDALEIVESAIHLLVRKTLERR